MPNYSDFERRVFILLDKKDRFLGTGFSVLKPGLLLTGKHNLSSCNQDDILAGMLLPNGEVEIFSEASSVSFHPHADIVAVSISDNGQDCFEMGREERMSLGMDVASYGFCLTNDTKEGYSQYSKGYVKRSFLFEDKKFSYPSVEMSFPSFQGHSGSPVFLENSYRVVGLLTNRRLMEETVKTEAGMRVSSSATFSIGIDLLSFSDWIDNVSKEM